MERDRKMTTRQPQSWWKRSRMAALAVSAALLAASAAATALAPAGEPKLFGLPLWQFLCVAAFPFLLAAALWRFSTWQEATDRAFSVYEED